MADEEWERPSSGFEALGATYDVRAQHEVTATLS